MARQQTHTFGKSGKGSFGKPSGGGFGKQIGRGRSAEGLAPTDRFTVPGRVLVGEIDKLRPLVDPSPGLQQGGPFVVQGKKASDLEWRVYRMLRQLGWNDNNMVFQTAILGGRNPGGQMLDYVLYGPGHITVINVNGDYWHKYGSKNNISEYKEQQVALVMPGARVFSLYNADLATDEIALSTLLRLAGRGI